MYRGKHVRHKRLHQLIRGSIIAAVVILLLWPFVEPRTLSVDRHTVTVRDLDPASGMLKIVYVADIHQAGFPWFSQSQVNALVDKINSQDPDIVLLGGDYAADPSGTEAFFMNLPKINNNYGVYAVLGDADRGPDTAPEDIESLRKVMKSKNITLLVNEVGSFKLGQQTIRIAGVDLEDVGGEARNVGKVSAQVRSDELVILLAHSPAAIDFALKSSGSDGGNGKWFDLGLFGHTHGGQLPGGLNLFGIAEDLSDRTVGWFQRNKIDMLVTRGVGTTVMPIRIACQPQIHVITLQGSKK